MIRFTLVIAVLTVGVGSNSYGQIYRVAELNTEQIRALDRARTAVILPGGILEQHGPYLPSYSDGYFNERIATAIAEAIVAQNGWVALVFPSVPLGVDGANAIGRKHSFPGTYAVRATTLRSVFMDLANELGDQGFRWIFIVHGHGGLWHSKALHQAGDYFHDTYGGQMVHIGGLLPLWIADRDALDSATRAEDRFSVHAGANETSMLLYLRPDLVAPSHKVAEAHTGDDMAALVSEAVRSSWPGYFGSPRKATAAQGARTVHATADAAVRLTLQILDGKDPRTIPRISDSLLNDPVRAAIADDALRHQHERQRKQDEWLIRNKLH